MVAPSLAAPLLEREQERELLGAAWRQTRAGRGATWFVCAEAGGGKTRLLQEIAAAGRTL
jgi:hypothetical protein